MDTVEALVKKFVDDYNERAEQTDDKAATMAYQNIARTFGRKSLDFAMYVLEALHATTVMQMQELTRDDTYGYYLDLKTCREIYSTAIVEIELLFA